jgi:hypothetical protein
MRVTMCESRDVRQDDRDLLLVQAVECVHRAERWYYGRQRDAFVVALREKDGGVSIFEGVLQRTIQLDAEEVGSTSADAVRLAIGRAV